MVQNKRGTPRYKLWKFKHPWATYGGWTECVSCGTTKAKHLSLGFCADCYDKIPRKKMIIRPWGPGILMKLD
jgi:hypothetical protein